jgi:NitT/TauT family transport system substrate-binding protein
MKLKQAKIFALVLASIGYVNLAGAQALKVPYVSLAGTQLPLFIGETTGLFKKNHLDIQLIYIPGGSLIVQTLISGDAGIASLAPPAGMVAWAKGASLVVIAGGIERLNHMLIVTPKIKKPEDLKGKRVGISRYGSLTDLALGEALRLHKLAPGRDVAVIQVGGLGERVAALTSGLIDGVVVQADQMFQLERLGYPVLIDLRKLSFNYPTQGILANREFVRNRKEMVKGFLKAYVEGIKILKTERQLTMDTLGKYLKISDREILSKTYDVYKDAFERIPYVSREVVTSALYNIPDLSAKASTLNLDNLIDNTIMQELEKEGFFRDLYSDSSKR